MIFWILPFGTCYWKNADANFPVTPCICALVQSYEECGCAEDVLRLNCWGRAESASPRRGCNTSSPPGGSSSEAGNVLLVDTHTNTDRPCMYAHPAMQINTGGHAQHSRKLHQQPHPFPSWLIRMKWKYSCPYLAPGSCPSGYLHWDR